MATGKVIYNYEAQDKAELTIHEGDIIKILSKVQTDISYDV